MRKFVNKLLVTLGAGMLITFTACEEGDTVFDQIVDQEQRGAILRTISVFSDELPIGSLEGEFSVELEMQDQEDGALIGSIEVYHSFRDNSDADGPGDVAEVLVETISASSFTIGEFGYPRITYTAPITTLLSNTGVLESELQGSDQFRIRFELVLTDGRRFSNDDNTGTLTQTFFSSPFLYSATIVCPPPPPTPGTWTLAQQDSYGDSWNGASIDVTIDDVTTNYAHAGGSETIFTFEVPDGATSIQVVYNPGTWDSENTFQLISANGGTVLDLGPEPPINIALLDYCDLTLNL